MPSATRRGSIAMLKSRDLVSPLAVMRDGVAPVGARAPLRLGRPHDHAREHDRAFVTHVPREAVDALRGRDQRGGPPPKNGLSRHRRPASRVFGVPVKVRNTLPWASRNSIFTSDASLFRK